MAAQWQLPGTDIVIDLAPGAGQLGFGHLVLGQGKVLEDICAECQHATLFRAEVHMVNESGVGLVGSITQCAHCMGFTEE